MLNVDKCSVTYFKGKKSCNVDKMMQLKINNILLPIKDCVKSLGLYLDSSLTFTKNTTSLVQKSFMNLKLLYSNRELLSRKLRVLLAEALVLSFFNYCNYIYGPFLDLKNNNRIQKVQNSCCRFVFGLRRFDRVTPGMTELGWLNMANRRRFHFACFVRSIMLNGRPEYLRTRLQFRNETHALNTRYSCLLSVPKHKTATFKKCFSYRAATVYNSLAEELKGMTERGFRKKYRKVLLDDQQT